MENLNRVSLDERINDDTQTIGELWEFIAKIGNNVKKDNEACGYYPIGVREMQLVSLKSLVDELLHLHHIFSNRQLKKNDVHECVITKKWNCPYKEINSELCTYCKIPSKS